MLGGITQHSIQLVVLLRSDVERSCATDEHGIILEYFLNLREHRASFDLVRIESEFGLLAGLGAKQSESHHTGPVIFKRLAAEVGVTIFLAQIVAALLEELFVHLRLVLPDNLELAVHNTAFGHAIVAKDCDRIFTHLLVDSLAIAGPRHDDLVTLCKSIEHRPVGCGQLGLVLSQSSIQVKADQLLLLFPPQLAD